METSLMESINEQSINGLPETDNNSEDVIQLKNKLSESEDKLHKFKALAVKLKKELNETKNQLSKSLTENSELKTELKNTERDKISVSYQQVVRNFQSLQTEYDNIQDQSDCLKARNKELEKDLSETITELTKTREQLAEARDEIQSHKTTINGLRDKKQSLESKKRELESKVIVLQSDLESEHKRNVSNTGLEHSINELHHQLDVKTTEIVELTDRLEKANEDLKKFEELSGEQIELISKLDGLEKENSNLKEDIKKYSETVETQLSDIENFKIRCAETSALLHNLEVQSKASNESQIARIRSLEAKVEELNTYISDMEIELKKKDTKFEEYRTRVTKVLKQQENGVQIKDKNSKQIESLEATIDTLNSELNSLKESLKISFHEKESIERSFNELNSSHNLLKNQINEFNTLKERMNDLKNENEKLKSLARELQSALVSDRKQTEEVYKAQIKELNGKHNSIITELNQQLAKSNKEIEDLRLEIVKFRNSDQLSDSYTKSHHSINNSDDLESVETISISEKKVSLSPTSTAGNVLHDILYASDTQEIKPTQDFTKHLTLAQNKVDNLTQLLEDSESNNLLIAEQNRVLKEEIRRLQRSIERLEMAENLEYLKNIIVKFISFNGEEERQRLIPVLATVLKLSPDEQNQFQSFVATDQSGSSRPGWSGYLYGWKSANK